MVYINRRRDKLLEDEIMLIAMMYAEGFSQNYIAVKFHVDRSTVRYHLRRSGAEHEMSLRYSQQQEHDTVEVQVTEESVDFTMETEGGRRIDWIGHKRVSKTPTVWDKERHSFVSSGTLTVEEESSGRYVAIKVPETDKFGRPLSDGAKKALMSLDRECYSERRQKPKMYIDYIIDQYKREGKVVPYHLLRKHGRKTM